MAIEALKEAKYFYQKMQGTAKIPKEFRHNFNAFISRARSVTWVLRKQHSENPKFKTWYGKKEKEMKNDELMRFFKVARNVSVKEHPLRTQTSTYIRHMEINVPKGRGFAITGEGEAVWVDKDEAGKEKRIHAREFDSEIARAYYFDKPRPPLLYQNLQVIDLCGLYLRSLEDIVEEASRILSE